MKRIFLLALLLVIPFILADHVTQQAAPNTPITSNVASGGKLFIGTQDKGGLIQIEATGTPALPHINLIDPAVAAQASRLYVRENTLFIEQGPLMAEAQEGNPRITYNARLRIQGNGNIVIENAQGNIVLNPLGLIGIGTERPGAKLSIVGGPPGTKVNWHKAISLGNADAIQFTGKSSFGLGASSSGDSLYFFTAPEDNAKPPNYILQLKNNGNVDVRGALSIDMDSKNYDVWIQGGSSGSTAGGNARNLALLGSKKNDKLFLNYDNEYRKGTVIGGDVVIEGNLTVGGDLLGGKKSYGNRGFGPKQVCVDHWPGLIYETKEIKGELHARVYLAGTNPAGGVWGWGCGGDPGHWKASAGKVLFAEWSWDKTSQKKVKVTAYLIVDYNNRVRNDEIALLKAEYTRETKDNTRTRTRDKNYAFTASGAQSPSATVYLNWDDDNLEYSYP